MTLRVASKALAVGAHADRLRAVLNEYFGFVVQVHFEIGAAQGQSAHAVDLAALAARQRAAEHSVTIDPFVQALMKDFGAHVVPGSIRPGHASQSGLCCVGNDRLNCEHNFFLVRTEART
jgi:DNA polymerase-3 subunit gamma/tau